MTKGDFIMKWLSKPDQYNKVNVDEMRQDLDKLVEFCINGIERPSWLSEELETEALEVFDSGSHLKAVKMLVEKARPFITNHVTWSYEYLKRKSELNKIKR